MRDPWRPSDSEPLTKPAPAPRPGQRINPGDDIDQDLRTCKTVRIRSERNGAIKIEHVDLDSVGDAIYHLARCLIEIYSAKPTVGQPITDFFNQVGASVGNVSVGNCDEGTGYWFDSGNDIEPRSRVHLCFKDREQGLIHLMRLLSAAKRKHPKILQRWGVEANLM